MKPRNFRRVRAVVTSLAALSLMALAPARAETSLAQLASQPPAPLTQIVGAVEIPHESFTLPNGLKVVVHTDRKAPLVSVGVWYHVGSKDEPPGKSGYAHLFEHLMFYGSENSPGEHFKPLEAIGASDFNGTTSFDRTNYFQTVPTPALDLALFLESDRMGWLLPALTQEKLDQQRKVVRNEKRQGDNRHYGLTLYALLAGVFPPENPYSQATIGRVADLDRATLDDAHDWFRTRYGPNNAVLVLAGDIDVETARPMVEKWFGQIPAGPTPPRFKADVPSHTKTRSLTLHDRIATPRLIRAWPTPGGDDPDTVGLSVAMAVLGGGQTSRLYEALVREQRLAASVSASISVFEKAGLASIAVDLLPGVDPASAEAAVDAELARFLKDGPTRDEVDRVAMRAASGTVRGLEKVGGFGGKGAALAEGALYHGDPGFWRRELQAYAAATPDSVTRAARRFVSAGDFRLTILPGDREDTPIDRPLFQPQVESPEKPARPAPAVGTPADRSAPPAAGPATRVDVPEIARARLSNGIEVLLASRSAIPVVRVAISFPVGIAGDSRKLPGTQQLMLAMADEGINGKLGPIDGPDLNRRQERLGASLGASATLDRTRYAMSALTPNLPQTLALFADMVRAPAFPADQLERVRGQMLAGLAAQDKDPNALAMRALPALIYPQDHPYGLSFSGSGTAQSVAAIDREALAEFHRRLDPARARIVVVGDTDMAAILPLLEQAFGDWQSTGAETPDATATRVSPSAPRILLIDRPGSPQAILMGGAPSPLTGRDDTLAVGLLNDVFGGLTTSRLFQLLREEKGWSYGASSSLSLSAGQMPFILQAAVDTAHVGDSIVAIRQALDSLHGDRPPTAAEIDAARAGSIRSLPGNLETAGALLATVERNAALGRPDTYLETLPARLEKLTHADVASAPLAGSRDISFVVVGDAKTIRPQLDATGLPVDVQLPAETVAASAPPAAK